MTSIQRSTTKKPGDDQPPSILRRLLFFRKKVLPEEVLRHYRKKGAALTIRILRAEEDEGAPMVLLEGDRKSLLYLADLLLAQAADTRDCGFQIELDYRGFLGDQSECGLYIHSLPCANDPGGGRKSDSSTTP